MYKTETHLHTSEVSGCGWLKGEEMVTRYKAAGYTTVFITDHFYPQFFDKHTDIPWNDRIDLFLTGYRNAKIAGDRLGVNVLMSAEYGFRNSPNHYLVYGIDREFLCAYPDVMEMQIEQFSEIAARHKLLLIQAHPYRDGNCYPTPEYVDGVEVYNFNQRHDDSEEKAYSIAQEYGLYMTSGSDAHRPEDVGLGGVMTDSVIKSAEDYIRLIKNGKAKLISSNVSEK